MGRIVTSVRITNVKHPETSMRCDALVNTGASYLVLPRAWKERLGEIEFAKELLDVLVQPADLALPQFLGNVHHDRQIHLPNPPPGPISVDLPPPDRDV